MRTIVVAIHYSGSADRAARYVLAGRTDWIDEVPPRISIHYRKKPFKRHEK
jgi:hypothetical protein